MSISENIFILGAPRSGTTFLAGLLSLTRYGTPFETHFITKYYHKLNEYGDLEDINNFKRLLTDILAERAVMQWQLALNIDSFYQQLEGNFDYAYIVDQLCLLPNRNKNLLAWGDKTPSYIGEIEIIFSLYPNARFIQIVRDGRDVALSLLRCDWGPNNLYCASEYWSEFNKKNKIIDKLQTEGKLYSVRYEDLLDNTEQHVKAIYSFLDEEVPAESIEKLCSKVKKGNYYKWKKNMTDREISIFESVSAHTLTRLGYETSYPQSKINFFVHHYYKIHNKFMWLKFMFVHNLVDGIKIRYFGKEPFSE